MYTESLATMVTDCYSILFTVLCINYSSYAMWYNWINHQMVFHPNHVKSDASLSYQSFAFYTSKDKDGMFSATNWSLQGRCLNDHDEQTRVTLLYTHSHVLMSTFDLLYLNKGNVHAHNMKIPFFMQVDEVEDQHEQPRIEMTNNKMMVTTTK